MVKTLITLGYHCGELKWGEIVKDEYLRQNLKGARDVTFYSVKSSDIESGAPCKKAADEIKKIVKKDNYGLCIDVHCGLTLNYNGLIKEYIGMNDQLIQRVKSYDDVGVIDLRIVGSKIDNLGSQKDFKSIHMRDLGVHDPKTDNLIVGYIKYVKDIGVPSAMVDAFLPIEEFEEKGESFQKMLKETLKFINDIYDIHAYQTHYS